MKRALNYVGLGVLGVVGSVGVAMAEFTITPPSLDVTQLGTYGSAILVGLAAIWLLRKMIKTTNRS